MPEIAPNDRQPDLVAVRILCRDKADQPVAGVVVSISEAPSERDKQSRLIATLESDLAGYVSFKEPSSNIASSSRLIVAREGSAGDALVLNVADLLAGKDTYTIQVDPSDVGPVAPSFGLPAVMLPDVRDLALSPGSIGMIPRLSPSQGLCAQIMPTTMGVRRFEAFQVIPADSSVPTFGFSSFVSC